MKHESAEKKGKKPGHSKMESFEKAMHGKNRGAGYKGYKGGM